MLDWEGNEWDYPERAITFVAHDFRVAVVDGLDRSPVVEAGARDDLELEVVRRVGGFVLDREQRATDVALLELELELREV